MDVRFEAYNKNPDNNNTHAHIAHTSYTYTKTHMRAYTHAHSIHKYTNRQKSMGAHTMHVHAQNSDTTSHKKLQQQTHSFSPTNTKGRNTHAGAAASGHSHRVLTDRRLVRRVRWSLQGAGVGAAESGHRRGWGCAERWDPPRATRSRHSGHPQTAGQGCDGGVTALAPPRCRRPHTDFHGGQRRWHAPPPWAGWQAAGCGLSL